MKAGRRDDLARWGNRVLLSVNIALTVILVIFFSTRKLNTSDNIEYKDLIVIVLTALAVLLAVVTLFVAALAIYGYATLRDLAVQTAKSTAEEVAPPAAAREAEAIMQREGTGEPGPDLVAALQTGEDEQGEDRVT